MADKNKKCVVELTVGEIDIIFNVLMEIEDKAKKSLEQFVKCDPEHDYGSYTDINAYVESLYNPLEKKYKKLKSKLYDAQVFGKTLDEYYDYIKRHEKYEKDEEKNGR